MNTFLDHRQFIRKVPTETWCSPSSSQVVVEFIPHNDEPSEIISIAVHGKILSGETLSFFERWGFDMEELAEHLSNLEQKV